MAFSFPYLEKRVKLAGGTRARGGTSVERRDKTTLRIRSELRLDKGNEIRPRTADGLG